MISLYYGDNYVLSRQRLNQHLDQLKTNQVNLTRFLAKDLSLEALTQALESNSLFNLQPALIIENLFSLPAAGLKNSVLSLIVKNQHQTIILWDKKPLTKTNLKPLTQVKTIKFNEFKLPLTVFKFLDSIIPNQGHIGLKYLHQSLHTNPIELVFYFLSRRVSQLILAESEPQTLKSSPWQKNKLVSQATNFTLDQLIQLHHQLLKLDYINKTGQTPFDLLTELDLLLVNL